MIQPIDTYYNGNYFRSRLEARWAYFFDCYSFKYVYEPAGFRLDSGVKYLPDFYLPDLDKYAEVKPSYQSKVVEGNSGLWGWAQRHPDYNSKWLPFSEHYSLIILVDKPGDFLPIQIHKKFHKYNIEGLCVFTPVEEWNFDFDIDVIEAARKERFQTEKPRLVLPQNQQT